MALVARVLQSISERTKGMRKGSFVGTCLCPDCGKILEVRDVNGHKLR